MPRRSFRALAVLLGTLGGLVVLEVGLRVTAGLSRRPPAPRALERRPPPAAENCAEQAEQARLGDLFRPSAHPDIVYTLAPAVDTCFEGARVRTSAGGLRAAREYARPKPDGVHRILLLGDSQAFGWAVELEATAGAVLEARLSGSGTGAPVEVVNAAVPGYNTFQEAAWLEETGMSYEPDCVIVLFTANDLALPFFLLRAGESVSSPRSYLWAALRRATGGKRWYRWTREELIDFVTETEIDRVPAAYRHMVGVGAYREALARIAAAARPAGIPVVNVAPYGSVPVDAAELVRLNQTLGLVHLPLRWSDRPEHRTGPADPHPNAAGHRVFARRLLRELRARRICLPPGFS